MKLLLDTNVIIPVEPTDRSNLEPTTEVIALLWRVCQQLGFQLYIHPASLEELARDRDHDRRDARWKLIHRYLPLPSPPEISTELQAIVGRAPPGSHDEKDNRLLAAVHGDAVDLLVTSDTNLLKKARRAGHADRVATPTVILKKLQESIPPTPSKRPAVDQIVCHQLDESEDIFQSLRTDYLGFDLWLAKCKREHRIAWIIKNPKGEYAAITIIKREDSNEYGFIGRILKVCTFIVHDLEFGHGYGELLLKPLFEYAFLNRIDSMFLEVLPKHQGVIRHLRRFGFIDSGNRSGRGELVLIKQLRCSPEAESDLSPLEFSIQCGPPRVMLEGARVFVIPIQPQFHAQLFPDLETQGTLLPGHDPFGNAILKAYLCHAKVLSVPPGSILLFYRSQDAQSVQCVGVTESSHRCTEPQRVLNLVGARTVYRFRAIEEMCESEVLVLLFRHSFALPAPLSLDELIGAGVLKSHPQSVLKVPPEAYSWLRQKFKKWL